MGNHYKINKNVKNRKIKNFRMKKNKKKHSNKTLAIKYKNIKD